MKAADVREMCAMLFGMTLAELQLGVLIGFRRSRAARRCSAEWKMRWICF